MIEVADKKSSKVVLPDDRQKLFVVTVTYGDRAELLKAMLTAVSAEGILDVVVVDNAALHSADVLQAAFPSLHLHVAKMGRNTGSAVGFAKGIEVALASGAEMVWLLDDDNRPLPGALTTLVQSYKQLSARWSKSQLAVLAFRPEHQADVAKGLASGRINPRPSSFLGFHVLDLPRKLKQRILGARRIREVPATVGLDIAPYSGLMLHRDAIEVIGLPRADFVLYSDDVEWSYRITRMGGQIMLIAGAQIEDMESSWNVKREGGSALSVMLDGPGDFRAYYGVRNASFFFTHLTAGNELIKWLNRRLYVLLLWIVSRRRGRRARYRLLRRAIRDGVAGRLGMSEEFPL
jgi:GT2 family glycosyltransferase